MSGNSQVFFSISQTFRKHVAKIHWREVMLRLKIMIALCFSQLETKGVQKRIRRASQLPIFNPLTGLPFNLWRTTHCFSFGFMLLLVSKIVVDLHLHESKLRKVFNRSIKLVETPVLSSAQFCTVRLTFRESKCIAIANN